MSSPPEELRCQQAPRTAAAERRGGVTSAWRSSRWPAFKIKDLKMHALSLSCCQQTNWKLIPPSCNTTATKPFSPGKDVFDKDVKTAGGSAAAPPAHGGQGSIKHALNPARAGSSTTRLHGNQRHLSPPPTQLSVFHSILAPLRSHLNDWGYSTGEDLAFPSHLNQCSTSGAPLSFPSPPFSPSHNSCRVLCCVA